MDSKGSGIDYNFETWRSRRRFGITSLKRNQAEKRIMPRVHSIV
jgi:hypothetical protein